MKRTLLLCVCLSTTPLLCQAQADKSQDTNRAIDKTASVNTVADASNFTSTKGFVLEDGLPVKLRINRTVSSADAHVGDTVDFEVLQEININGKLVIPKGGLAFATVTGAQSKRRMARGGKLDINIDYVRLLSGDRAALRAIREVKGGGHTGAMTGGIVATSLVFFPAAPFFLFMHGKDITIPKGTEITAYVNGDMKLDPVKFQQTTTSSDANPMNANSNNQGDSSTHAKLQVESEPPGADIELDGNFVGNTPSEFQVVSGDHSITLKKAGFNSWERKLRVNAGGSIRLKAELEKSNP